MVISYFLELNNVIGTLIINKKTIFLIQIVEVGFIKDYIQI